jgi:hypothetical protein
VLGQGLVKIPGSLNFGPGTGDPVVIRHVIKQSVLLIVRLNGPPVGLKMILILPSVPWNIEQGP